jgi:large subunit ribosomal protein L25
MNSYSLVAEIRTKDEVPSEVRTQKSIPAVVYGKTQEPISIKINNSDFLRIYRQAGESTIINLSVGKKEMEVLVHSVQKHPRTDAFTHIDFYAITKGQKLHANIHLNFIGDSPAKREGAIIEEYIREIEVKCLAKDLVNHFDVNLELLKDFDDTITFADLGLDATIYETHHHNDDVIAKAGRPKIEVIEDAAPVAAVVGDSSGKADKKDEE